MRRRKLKEEEIKAMRSIQKFIFTLLMVAGLTLAVSAQKDDQKKPPPKGDPPVVTPQPKNPPPQKPPSNTPQKPGMYAWIARSSSEG